MLGSVDRFTPWHRGGSGPPLIAIHGFADTWRTWELVLPMLEARHDVLAVTLPGHAGGPQIDRAIDDTVLADGIEAAMDAIGWRDAHLVGNSLGGFVALRGGTPTGAVDRRARPRRGLAGGGSLVQDAARATAAPLCVCGALIAHQIRGVGACPSAGELIDHALACGFELDAEAVDCPVRIIWGMQDRLLPYPCAATGTGTSGCLRRTGWNWTMSAIVRSSTSRWRLPS